MPRPSPSDQAVKATTVFVVFVCVALLAVNAWLALRMRDEVLRQTALAGSNLTQAMAQQIDSMLLETGRLLDTVAFDVERANNHTAMLERLQPVLVHHVAATEHLHSVFVMDAQGQRTVGSESTGNASASDAQRAYFIHHRANLSLMHHVGAPYRSRVNDVWLIPVSRRLDDPEGHFAGVVLATIDVAYVRQLMAGYETGQHAALALSLIEGSLVARHPFSPDDLGRRLVSSAQIASVQRNRFGTIELVSPFDGVDRIVSYRHLKNHPLLVTVALSKHEVLQHWRTTTYVQTGWMVLLCGLMGLSGGIVVGSVRGRLRVEHRLRAAHDELTLVNTQLTRLARLDGLTGLANRRAFDEHLAREFALCLRTGRPLALIMIDVDHFKLYNDTYGHPAGDQCLQAVARAVASAVGRPHDLVARYGGEEMSVLLAETDAPGAGVVAENIRLAVAQLQLPFGASPLGYVCVSAGVAAQGVPRPGASAAELLNAADQALYQAKRNGRNCVVTETQSPCVFRMKGTFPSQWSR